MFQDLKPNMPMVDFGISDLLGRIAFVFQENLSKCQGSTFVQASSISCTLLSHMHPVGPYHILSLGLTEGRLWLWSDREKLATYGDSASGFSTNTTEAAHFLRFSDSIYQSKLRPSCKAIRPPYFSGCIWAIGFSFMIVPWSWTNHSK